MKTIKSMAIFALALSLSASVFAGSQKVDAAKSSVKWLGKKVTGQHDGTIGIKEGNLEVNNGKVTGGKVVIDMSSLAVLDLKDPGMNGKLTGHLKSDDFFGVATYPTADLVITKVEGNTFSGNLTIKGITNPISFTANSVKAGKTTTYTGTMVINQRQKTVS